MKLFPERTDRRPLTRGKAWVCLLINALVCPGLGSLMGRRLSGWPQLALAWGGAIWMVVILGRYLMVYVQRLQAPQDWRSYVQAGTGGLIFFLAGWIWSIGTGLLLLLRARPPTQVEQDTPIP
jgi:hypothetical protein